MPALNRFSTWLILAAILLLAAFLRFWQLETLPPGLYHDEAYNGLDALSLLEGDLFPRFYEGWELYTADAHAQRPARETRFPLFFEGNYGREPLHVYLMALSISLFGETPFALRAIPAAAGVLGVLTTFLAARALFSAVGEGNAATRVALLAAFFLAVLYPAVHFSRFGIRAMLFVPVETMAVATFWWGVNRAHSVDTRGDFISWLLFLASGFFVGLGIYTFAASRLFPLVWLLFVPLWFWLDREALAAHWRHVLGMATAAFLTALPLLFFFARYPYYFVFRIAYVANKGTGAVEGRPLVTWLLNTGRVARGLFWQGETHLRHNLPGRPYFDPIQAILFLLGAVRSVLQIRQTRYLFLLLWFLVMLLPSVLSGDAPHFGRLSGSYAPAVIIVALGADWLWRSARDLLARLYPPRTSAFAAGVLLLILLAGSTYLTYRDYFQRYANHPDLAADFYEDEWQLGRYAATSTTPDARLLLSPTQEELATIYFALGDPDRLRNYNGSADLLPAGTPGLESLYLLRSDDQEAVEALLTYFPQAAKETAIGNFVPYRVPAGAVRPDPQHETDIRFDDTISLLGWSAEPGEETLNVTLYWQVESEMENDYTAFLHLTGADGELLSQVDQPPAGYPTSDWVPGEIIVARFALPLPGDVSLEDAALTGGFYLLPALQPLGETALLAGPGELAP